MAGDDLFGAVKVVGFSIIGLAVIAIVLNSVFGIGMMTAQETTSGAVEISGDSASLPGYNITDPTVNQSLGHAARLDGSSNSFVSGSSDVELEGDWTVTTYVRVDNLSRTQTVVSVSSEQMLLYNGSTGEWVGVYYDDATGETYSVSQVASDPSNLTNVALMHDGGALSIIENNNFSSTIAANSSNAVSRTFAARNLDGDLDETRTFNRSLNSTERQQLVDRPTAPLPGTSRTYRVMYDSYSSSPTSYPAFFVSEQVTATNVQRVDGLDAEATTAGTDYQRNGDTITVLDGGSLDGAPALYASYGVTTGPFVGVLSALQTTGGAALGLLVVGLLAFAGSRLMGFFDDGY